MKLKSENFRVKPGKKVALSKKGWPTLVKPFYRSKEHYLRLLDEHVEEMKSLQDLLYASNRFSVLLIFQAMDAAGKDGVIKHVMSGINPQGVQVYSFKHPSPEELEHDFLWRTTCCLPERGRIGIFNRSYYEEVLIARVHPEIIKGEGLPVPPKKHEQIWEHRFESINGLEEHLNRSGTLVIKFFLHLSKEEQRRRFIDRIDEPRKNWKLSSADIEERKFWDKYMDAYSACLTATSTKSSSWYIVPADDKENARLIVSQVILETLQSLKMAYPKLSQEKLSELKVIRKKLVRG